MHRCLQRTPAQARAVKTCKCCAQRHASLAGFFACTSGMFVSRRHFDGSPPRAAFCRAATIGHFSVPSIAAGVRAAVQETPASNNTHSHARTGTGVGCAVSSPLGAWTSTRCTLWRGTRSSGKVAAWAWAAVPCRTWRRPIRAHLDQVHRTLKENTDGHREVRAHTPAGTRNNTATAHHHATQTHEQTAFLQQHTPRIRVFVCMCKLVWMCVRTNVAMYVCVHARLCPCMYAGRYARMFVYKYCVPWTMLRRLKTVVMNEEDNDDDHHAGDEATTT